MSEFNPKEHLKATLMIFTALLGGLFIFAVIAFLMTYNKVEPVEGMEHYIYLALGMSAIVLFLGGTISNSLTKKAEQLSFFDKLNLYRRIVILRAAMYEGAAIIAIVFYLLTAQLALMAISAVMVFMFRFLRPTPIRAAKTVKLTQKEAKQLI